MKAGSQASPLDGVSRKQILKYHSVTAMISSPYSVGLTITHAKLLTTQLLEKLPCLSLHKLFSVLYSFVLFLPI